MIDAPDDHLYDGLILEEIRLLSEVMIAATSSCVPLSREQIDELLGLLATDSRVVSS